MTIDPKFIEKAHALAGPWCKERLRLGAKGHLPECQAIARALQDARDEENRACESELRQRAQLNGDAGQRWVLTFAADAIAARRGPE